MIAHAALDAPDLADLHAQIDPIPGFLFPVAADGTAWLLRDQERRAIRGGLVEIGIFQGKYFAVLARSAQSRRDVLLGIDTFTYSEEDRVHAAMRASPATRNADIRIWARASSSVSAGEILGTIGGLARFVSIDGSHDAPDVLGDLRLAERGLASDGVVAIDDFLNPRALGVGEAAHRFFAGRPDLVPFALFGNKLFCCRPGAAASYGRVVETFFERSELPEAVAYRSLRRLGREHVEQRLFDATLLVM